MWWILILIVAVIALVLFGVSAFNKLRRLDILAQEALGGIDVQLTRRADLVPNLVETVKGYAAHEKGLFEEVTAARAGVAAATQSGTVEQRAEAEAALDRALVHVMAVAENYPDLKASTNFLDLQRQLADTENQLAFARQYYNDAVSSLNTAVATVPTMFFTGVAGVSRRAFYQAPADDTAPPQVSFEGPAGP
jgi:LemA protein